MKLVLQSRKKEHYAEADYSAGKIIVLKGSKINKNMKYPRMSFEARRAREDSSIVDDDGIVTRDIEFSSPSTAAQFVTGRSVNGYISWRTNNDMSLKEYLMNEK